MPRVNTWISSTGYRVLRVGNKLKQYSNYVWWQNTGHMPDFMTKSEVIHHIDGDKLNDNFENLQLMKHDEHARLHNIGVNNPMHGRLGENNPNFGSIRSEETRIKQSLVRMGEKHQFYGKTQTKCHNWIYGPVCYKTFSTRVHRARKRIAEGRGTDRDYQFLQDNKLEVNASSSLGAEKS